MLKSPNFEIVKVRSVENSSNDLQSTQLCEIARRIINETSPIKKRSMSDDLYVPRNNDEETYRRTIHLSSKFSTEFEEFRRRHAVYVESSSVSCEVVTFMVEKIYEKILCDSLQQFNESLDDFVDNLFDKEIGIKN